MKLFLFLIGIVAAGILGFSFEPQTRYALTGKTPEVEKQAQRVVVVETGAPSKGIDPASYSADQLPEKVLLKADAEIADAASDLKMTVTAGNKVNLIRLEGNNVVISPGAGPFEGTVPISQTDLLDQLAALPKNPNPIPVEPPAMVDNNTPSEEPAATPAEPQVNPEEPEMTPEPEPTPAPEPEPAVPDGPVDVVAVMQASIKDGAIKEFSFDQVLDWQASEAPETIDGASYQTGVASYKAETVFGVKTIQAKALIKGGKVVKWLWPKSGMEIK